MVGNCEAAKQTKKFHLFGILPFKPSEVEFFANPDKRKERGKESPVYHPLPPFSNSTPLSILTPLCQNFN